MPQIKFSDSISENDVFFGVFSVFFRVFSVFLNFEIYSYLQPSVAIMDRYREWGGLQEEQHYCEFSDIEYHLRFIVREQHDVNQVRSLPRGLICRLTMPEVNFLIWIPLPFVYPDGLRIFTLQVLEGARQLHLDQSDNRLYAFLLAFRLPFYLIAWLCFALAFTFAIIRRVVLRPLPGACLFCFTSSFSSWHPGPGLSLLLRSC